MINTRNKKRAKVEAVGHFQKMGSKLSIMQWHFSQPSPNCVITAKRFFPDQPAKLRTVQNQAKKGLDYYTEKVANGITGPRATEGKGGLLPLLDKKMDEI